MTTATYQDATCAEREPLSGWNDEAEIARAAEFLRTVQSILFEEEAEVRVFDYCYRHGLDPVHTGNVIGERWPELTKEPAIWGDMAGRCLRFYCAQTKRAGTDAAGSEFEGLERKTIRQSVGGLSFSFADEIVAQPLEWVWQWRIPKAKLTLIAGYPGQGKSQILFNIAATVTNGGEWPNGEGRAELGCVIYLSAEDDESDTMVPRLASAGADLKKIVVLRSMVREFTHTGKTKRVLNIEDDLRKIEVVMTMTERERGVPVRMIIFDPISAYYGGNRKGDAHKEADMRALLTPVAEWAAERRVTVIGNSHFNKGGNAHTLYRIAGSLAIGAAARATHYVARNEETGTRLMLPGKHNLAPDEVKALEFEFAERDVSRITKVEGQTMPYVVWGSPSSLTTEEALGGGGRPGPKSNAVESAVEWMHDFLSDGPKPATEVFAEGGKLRLTPYALREAQARLGVESKKADFGEGWRWSLPVHIEQDFEDA
jgi:hypothetical protein